MDERLAAEAAHFDDLIGRTGAAITSLRKRFGVRFATDDRDESAVERGFRRVIQLDVILDRICQTTEQIRVSDDLGETIGQHRNRQRECPRHSGKYRCLKIQVGLYSAGGWARFELHGAQAMHAISVLG